MFYTSNTPEIKAKKALVQDRFEITIEQQEKIKYMVEKLKIPKSALIRMALDSFIPKTENCGYSEAGIKAGYLNGNY